MKRDKSFYCIFIMFLFVTCYLTCFIMSSRIIEFGGLIATAGAIIYPFTYFIAVLYYERYGKNKIFELINFTIIALIFMGIMLALASTFKVSGGTDGLEKIFNVDFRMLFAMVVAFIVGQYINIRLYKFLGHQKGFDFLISGTIAITIDSFLFIFLTYLGVAPFKEVICLATGQYVLSVIAIIIFALCFHSLIPSLLTNKDKALKEEEKELKTLTKTTSTKKSTTKTTAKKKSKTAEKK